MGKRKEVNIEPWESKSEDAAPEPVKPEVREVIVGEIIVGLPVADEVAERTYVSRHVEMNLTSAQATTLNKIMRGMDIKGERLNNGKRVVTKIDTIRRVLELAEASNG